MRLGVQRPATYPWRHASLLGLSLYVVDTAAALVRSGVVRVVRAMAPLLARARGGIYQQPV